MQQLAIAITLQVEFNKFLSGTMFPKVFDTYINKLNWATSPRCPREIWERAIDTANIETVKKVLDF